MSAITLRNLPPPLLRKIRERAARRGISLNRAVIELLEEGLDLRRSQGRRRKHHDLDEFFGAWSKSEAAAFGAVLAEHRKIDPELWA